MWLIGQSGARRVYAQPMTEGLVARLPAICRACGALFDSGFTIGGDVQLMSFGSTSGPCPRCGGIGDVPDGLWTLVPRALEMARQVRPTAEDLATLGTLIASQLKSELNLDALDARVEREAPSAMPLLSLARDPAVDLLVAFLTLLVTIATLHVASSAGRPEEDPQQRPGYQQDRGEVGGGPSGVGEDERGDPDGGEWEPPVPADEPPRDA